MSAAAAPVRLRLSRRKGFDLQALSKRTNGLPAVKVDRTTKWGNPFQIKKGLAMNCEPPKEQWIVQRGPQAWTYETEEAAKSAAVKMFVVWLSQPAQASYRQRAREALKWANLACWCQGVCHADIWLEILSK